MQCATLLINYDIIEIDIINQLINIYVTSGIKKLSVFLFTFFSMVSF